MGNSWIFVVVTGHLRGPDCNLKRCTAWKPASPDSPPLHLWKVKRGPANCICAKRCDSLCWWLQLGNSYCQVKCRLQHREGWHRPQNGSGVGPGVCFKCGESRYLNYVLWKSCAYSTLPLCRHLSGRAPDYLCRVNHLHRWWGFLTVSWFAVCSFYYWQHTEKRSFGLVNDVQRSHHRNKSTEPSPGPWWPLQFAQPVSSLVRKCRKLGAANPFHSAWSWPYLECWVL